MKNGPQRIAALPYWALSLLFAVRVAGQAIQEWMPITGLPPAHAFQSSNLPYPLLLCTQLVILGAMGRVAWRIQRQRLVPRLWVGLSLRAAGLLYMTIAIARPVAGLLVPEAAPWFRAWIPAFFHIVLAAFVLALSSYHVHGAQSGERRR